MLKLIIKRLLFISGIIATSPLILLTHLETLIRGRNTGRFFGASKEILSIIPSIIGEYMRSGYYWSVCTRSSPDASFMFGCMLARQNSIIRAGVVIGAYSIIGFADIGENVLIGPRVSILSGKYQHGKPDDRREGNMDINEFQMITIGKNSWIGQDAVLMANVGENCTVGAGSVVYKDVPDETTVLGNPARRVNL